MVKSTSNFYKIILNLFYFCHKSYIVFVTRRDVMNNSLQDIILKRMINSNLGAFTASDFVDIARH